MIHYLLTTQSGEIFQRGKCESEALIPRIPGLSYHIISESDPRRPNNLLPSTYDNLRRIEYPSIGEQLDGIWHAMDQGLLPKIEPMYSQILAVKQKHPKPSAT